MSKKFQFKKHAQAAREELKAKSVKVGDSKKRPGKVVKGPKPLGAGKELTLAFSQLKGAYAKGPVAKRKASPKASVVKPVKDNAAAIAARKIVDGEFDAWIANDASSDLYLVLVGEKFRVVSYNVKSLTAVVERGEFLNSNAGFRAALNALADSIK